MLKVENLAAVHHTTLQLTQYHLSLRVNCPGTHSPELRTRNSSHTVRCTVASLGGCDLHWVTLPEWVTPFLNRKTFWIQIKDKK